MIHRAFSIPMNKEKFEKELLIIKQIAIKNGYPLHLIQSLIHKKDERLAINSIFPKQIENKNYRSITYFGNISNNISKIISKISPSNIPLNISYKTFNSVGLSLINAKTKTAMLQKSGIYKLQCPQCNSVYIGQTSRNFDVRYNEHISAYRNKNPNRSHYAKHFLESQHKPTSNTRTEVLHVCCKQQELDFLEALEIKKYLNNPEYTILNEQINIGNSPLLDCLILD